MTSLALGARLDTDATDGATFSFHSGFHRFVFSLYRDIQGCEAKRISAVDIGSRFNQVDRDAKHIVHNHDMQGCHG